MMDFLEGKEDEFSNWDTGPLHLVGGRRPVALKTRHRNGKGSCVDIGHCRFGLHVIYALCQWAKERGKSANILTYVAMWIRIHSSTELAWLSRSRENIARQLPNQ